ncbi:retinol binding protein receptor-domain-containing protein [Paraphysoderma sedebokerense]|nr:retinol binding protein receptor-domain-containing protein [Paraphysoderma sedebokerense]
MMPTLQVVWVLLVFLSFKLVTSDQQHLACINSLQKDQNLIRNTNCIIPQGQWSFEPATWQNLPSVIYSFSGCCLPTPQSLNITTIAKVLVSGSPLVQTLPTDSLKPYIDDIDKGIADLQLSIAFTPLVLLLGSGFVVDLAFFDMDQRILAFSNSTSYQGVLQISNPEDSSDIVLQPPTSKIFNPVRIPATTRSISLSVYSSANMSICFNTFLAKIKVPPEETEIVKAAGNIRLNLAYVCIVNVVAIPLLLFLRHPKARFPIPINLIQRTQNRPLQIVLFISCSNWLFTSSLDIVNGTATELSAFLAPEQVVWFRMFIFVVIFLIGAMLYWPLFLCYDQSNTLWGSFLGLYSSIAILAFRIVAFIYQLDLSFSTLAAIEMLTRIPEVISLVILILYFTRAWFVTRRGKSKPLNEVVEWLNRHEYVRSLLSNTEYSQSYTVNRFPRSFEHLKEQFFRISGINPRIHYPSKLLIMVVLKITFLYQLGLLILRFFFGRYGISTACTISALVRSRQSDVISMAETLYSALLGCFLWASVGGFIFCSLLSFNIFGEYAADSQRIRRGNYDFIPSNIRRLLNLDSHIRFIGYGVGYGLLGGLCVMLEMLVTAIFIVVLSYVPLLRSQIWSALQNGAILVPFAITLAIRYTQSFVTQYIFVSRAGPNQFQSQFLLKPSKRLRSIFWQYNYLITFTDIVQGVTSFLFRLVLAVTSNALYSLNIDDSILAKGLRSWDAGYISYLSLVVGEHIYGNEIMIAFIGVLKESVEDSHGFAVSSGEKVKSGDRKFEIEIENSENQSKRSYYLRNRRAFNKWLVSYTLLKNPGLIRQRKRMVGATQPK